MPPVRPLDEHVSHARAFDVTDHLPALVAYVDREERYRFANTAYQRWYGIDPEAIVGRSVREVLGEAIYGRVEHFLRRALAGETVSYELEIPAGDASGTQRHIVADYIPDIVEGEVRGIHALVVDMTAHKQAEALGAEASLLLDVAFSVHEVAVAYMDRDFNFLRVNAHYARIDGREPSDFPGRNHFELYPNDRNARIFRQVVASGEPYHGFARPFQYAHAPERGTTHWDWSLLPIKGPNGRVGGLVLVLMDVTDRIEALEQIQESNARFRGLFEHSTDALLLVDATESEITQANPAAAALLGYAAHARVGMSLGQLLDDTSAVDRLRLLAGQADGQPIRLPLRCGDGSVLHAQVRVVPMETRGRPQWYVFLGRS